MPLSIQRAHARRPRRPRASRPSLDRLESRIALSIPGADYRVNADTTLDQTQAAIATTTWGTRTVVVWSEKVTDADTRLEGRILDPNGLPTGGDFIINNEAKTIDTMPAVAINDAGKIVVAWTRQVAGGKTEVRAATFTANGAPLLGLNKSILISGTSTADMPSVGIDAKGRFVVAYDDRTTNTSPAQYDVHLSLRKPDGTLQKKLDIASNKIEEWAPSVDMIGDGRFAVAYVTRKAPFSDTSTIVYQMYSSDGYPTSTAIPVVKSSDLLYAPNLSLFNSSLDGVIAYQRGPGTSNGDWNVQARIVYANGTVSNSIYDVASDPHVKETLPHVAVQPYSFFPSSFVVTYNVGPTGVGVTEFVQVYANENSLKSKVYGPWDSRTRPAVAVDGTGAYTVVYNSLPTPKSNAIDIYARRGKLHVT